jgi:hypothetical protein
MIKMNFSFIDFWFGLLKYSKTIIKMSCLVFFVNFGLTSLAMMSTQNQSFQDYDNNHNNFFAAVGGINAVGFGAFVDKINYIDTPADFQIDVDSILALIDSRAIDPKQG